MNIIFLVMLFASLGSSFAHAFETFQSKAVISYDARESTPEFPCAEAENKAMNSCENAEYNHCITAFAANSREMEDFRRSNNVLKFVTQHVETAQINRHTFKKKCWATVVGYN